MMTSLSVRKGGSFALTALAVSVLSSVANAQLTISFNSNILSHQTEFVQATDKLTLSKFDTSLGILQSVSLTLAGSVATSLTVTNSAATSSSGTVRTECAVTNCKDPLALINLNGIDMLTPTKTYSLSAGGSQTFNPGGTASMSDGGLSPYTSASILAEFTGPLLSPGTISFGIDTYT